MLADNYIRIAFIHIQQNGYDFAAAGKQEIDKRVFIRQMRPVDDQADHDLSRARSATQIDVTYKTGP